MADLSNLSDEELLSLYHEKKAGVVDGKTKSSGPKNRLNPDVKDARERIAREDKVFGRDAGGGGPLAGSGKALDNFMMEYFQGMPAVGEYLDEATAGGRTLGGLVGDYGKELAYRRERRSQYHKEAPVLSKVASGLGTVSGSVLAAEALAPTKALQAFNTLSRGKKILSGIALGGAGGGAEGYVSGFGKGEGGLDQRQAEAKSGGEFGALTGAGFGIVSPFAGEALGKLGLSKKRLKELYDQLGISGSSSKILKSILQQDDALRIGGKGATNLEQAGPGAIVGDIGPAARTQMDIQHQGGGRPAATINNAIDKRLEDTATRFAQTRERNLGIPEGTVPAQRAAKAQTEVERRVEFRDAYRKPVDYTQSYGQDILTNLKRIDPSHWGAVKQKARDLGWDVEDPKIWEQITTRPNTEQLDVITRGLQGVARDSAGQGAMKSMTDAGRMAGNQATAIRQLMRDNNRAYADALDVSGKTIRQIQGIDYGKELLNPSIETSTARLHIADRLDNDVASVKQGVSNYIEQVMANAKGAVRNNVTEDAAKQAQAAVMQLISPASRDKLSLILEPSELDDMLKSVNEMRRALSLQLSENSKTAARQAGQAAEREVTGSTAESLRKDIGGGWMTWLTRSGTFAFIKGKKAKELALEKHRRQVSNFLTKQVGPDNKPVRDAAKLFARERAYEKKAQRASGRGALAAPVAVPGLLDIFSADPDRDNQQ